MEELLSGLLKKQNQYGNNLTGQRTKNSFFSYGGYETVLPYAG
jgi:hypothetical protein